MSSGQFIHHVYFWLENPGNEAELSELIEGLKKLSVVETISAFHIGLPASTNREVIDSSYSVSWMLVFENKEDHDYYQTHPLHLKFIEDCKHLWKKVLVYDSEGVTQ